MTAKHRYLTLKQIAEGDEYPFTMGQLRDWIMKKNTTGIGIALKKIGKRLYVRQDLFDEWLEKISVIQPDSDQKIILEDQDENN